MADRDALISTYSHLPTFPRADSALTMLRKIASLVKPIMRRRSWHVGTLGEFYPTEQQNLLGMNHNGGQKIQIRLRYPSDRTLFLPLEEVVDTMLHELSHNVHGPHDAKFHALWNELRDEYMDLKLKGYSGEGFLSNGHKLGGRGVPMHEMRRQARAEAERRRQLQVLASGSGQKLGGAPVRRGVDMRSVIANAVDRRSIITKGCGSGTKEGDRAAEEASANGFSTKAEEDEANDKAINEALWELVQQEEDKAAGVEPEVWIAHTGGSKQSSRSGTPSASSNKPSRPPAKGAPPPPPASNKIQPPTNYSNRDYDILRPRQTSGLISEEERARRVSGHVDLTSSSDSEDAPRTPQDVPPRRPIKLDSRPGQRPLSPHRQAKQQQSAPHPPPQLQAERSKTWTCEICTLVNPLTFLVCDACGIERPVTAAEETIMCPADDANGQMRARYGATGKPPSRTLGVTTKPAPQQAPMGWNCNRCGTFMETQWWTCSACGTMKTAS